MVLPLITSEEDEEGVEGGTLLGLPELDNDLDVSEVVVCMYTSFAMLICSAVMF